jgi:GT2 family glycosyltransferase
MPTIHSSAPLTGILVLNYHHPEETLACVNSLLEREPDTTRILWLENDANATRVHTLSVLSGAAFPWTECPSDSTDLPPSGTVGVVFIPENLGYAGGNNVGLRMLDRCNVPYAWVLNNDTELSQGSSSNLVAAAEARPEVGAWGTRIQSAKSTYLGGVLNPKNLYITFCDRISELEDNPLAYISGCSLFFRTALGASIGFIPEEYFLYYEDPAFTLELRGRGHAISGVDSVVVQHVESLSTGRRSPLMEFYNKRNRWFFIQRYFPERLLSNRWRLFYSLQKYILRGRWTRLKVEILAFIDFRKGSMGRTHRDLSRKDLT